LRPEWRAVDAGGVLLVGRAETDHGAAGDERRARAPHRLVEGGADLVGVMAVAAVDGPARGLEPLPLVGRVREAHPTVDRDAVVVPEHDELAQTLASGEADRLVADPLHQAAVAGDHPGAVIDELLAEPCLHVRFRHRHADGGAEALAGRAGRRLDPRGMAVFGMAGGAGAELTEVAD